tara:strand:- start:1 stop:330 length:330 start_codon:yes stop_codon:yes gene_type:complete
MPIPDTLVAPPSNADLLLSPIPLQLSEYDPGEIPAAEFVKKNAGVSTALAVSSGTPVLVKKKGLSVSEIVDSDGPERLSRYEKEWTAGATRTTIIRKEKFIVIFFLQLK